MALNQILPRRRLPWAVPAVAVVGVVAFTLVPQAFAGDAHPTLPATTPQKLIASVDASTVHALSGTLTTTPDLGLPKLPSSDGNQISALLTEKATWRIAVDGTQKQRLTLVGTGQETDVIRNGPSVWTWDSSTQDATHYLGSSKAEPQEPATSTAEPTPMALAAELLKSIDPSTQVTIGQTEKIAGRSAYTLVLAPDSAATLVGRAVIAVDAGTGLPLSVALYPRGSSTAALTEQFTSVSYAVPAASAFSFTPPSHATVTTKTLTGSDSARPSGTPTRSSVQPHVVGKDWAAVGVVPAGSGTLGQQLTGLLSSGGGRNATGTLLQEATNAGPNGSRILQTRILSVLITRAGGIYLGAVPVAPLESLAAAGK